MGWIAICAGNGSCGHKIITSYWSRDYRIVPWISAQCMEYNNNDNNNDIDNHDDDHNGNDDYNSDSYNDDDMNNNYNDNNDDDNNLMIMVIIKMAK